MADMTRIKGRIAETIYPNGTGAITAESHQALLLEMVDTINREKADQSELVATQESLEALTDTVNNLPQGGGNFNPSGTYPDLTAGDLAGRGESVPAEFGFRASGGKSIKDGRAYIKRIKGNSVVWNQQSSGDNFVGDVARPFPQGATLVEHHKYLVIADAIENAVLYLYAWPIGGQSNYLATLTNQSQAIFFTSPITIISKGQDNKEGEMWWYQYALSDDAVTHRPRLIDLTQMFQAGNEPSTIEEYEARKPIVADEYAYNEGQVIHCHTESIKSVGDNAWDEQWIQGFYYEGQYIESPTQICSKNPTPVLPNATYCINQEQYYVWYYDKEMHYIGFDVKFNSETFVTPSNAAYIHFNLEPQYGVTYKNDIIVTLVHSGWKQDTDAGYQPYWQDTLPLPIIKKYFPDGMKLAGSAHDEIRYNKASGKWEYTKGKIKSVDLGDLTYYKSGAADNAFYTTDLQDDAPKEANKMLSAKFVYGDIANNETMSNDTNGTLYFNCSPYTDAASFKAMLQEKQVKLYYESNDWEWVELDEADQNFRDYYNVADFGTEMSQSAVPSAAFSADIIYQFNAVDMIREHEAEITELQKVIATMQAQLISLINGGQ